MLYISSGLNECCERAEPSRNVESENKKAENIAISTQTSFIEVPASELHAIGQYLQSIRNEETIKSPEQDIFKVPSFLGPETDLDIVEKLIENTETELSTIKADFERCFDILKTKLQEPDPVAPTCTPEDSGTSSVSNESELEKPLVPTKQTEVPKKEVKKPVVRPPRISQSRSLTNLQSRKEKALPGKQTTVRYTFLKKQNNSEATTKLSVRNRNASKTSILKAAEQTQKEKSLPGGTNRYPGAKSDEDVQDILLTHLISTRRKKEPSEEKNNEINVAEKDSSNVKPKTVIILPEENSVLSSQKPLVLDTLSVKEHSVIPVNTVQQFTQTENVNDTFLKVTGEGEKVGKDCIKVEETKSSSNEIIQDELQENTPVLEKAESSKNMLSVQLLPRIDIRRSLITQKIPNLVIRPEETLAVKQNIDNIKYFEYVHRSDDDELKEKGFERKTGEKLGQETSSYKTGEEISNYKTTENLKVKEVSDDRRNETLTTIPEADGIQILHQNLKIISERSSEITQEDAEDDIAEESVSDKSENHEKSVSISEELNLDIKNVPSLKTLHQIQSYLESRCKIIKTRLAEERQLKLNNRGISLRWELSQPPRWKEKTPGDEGQNITAVSKIKPSYPDTTKSRISKDSAPLLGPSIESSEIRKSPQESVDDLPLSIDAERSSDMVRSEVADATTQSKLNFLFNKCIQYSSTTVDSSLNVFDKEKIDVIRAATAPEHEDIGTSVDNLIFPRDENAQNFEQLKPSSYIDDTGNKYNYKMTAKDVTGTGGKTVIKKRVHFEAVTSNFQISPDNSLQKSKMEGKFPLTIINAEEYSARKTEQNKPYIKSSVKKYSEENNVNKEVKLKTVSTSTENELLQLPLSKFSNEYGPDIGKAEKVLLVTNPDDSKTGLVQRNELVALGVDNVKIKQKDTRLTDSSTQYSPREQESYIAEKQIYQNHPTVAISKLQGTEKKKLSTETKDAQVQYSSSAEEQFEFTKDKYSYVGTKECGVQYSSPATETIDFIEDRKGKSTYTATKESSAQYSPPVEQMFEFKPVERKTTYRDFKNISVQCSPPVVAVKSVENKSIGTETKNSSIQYSPPVEEASTYKSARNKIQHTDTKENSVQCSLNLEKPNAFNVSKNTQTKESSVQYSPPQTEINVRVNLPFSENLTRQNPPTNTANQQFQTLPYLHSAKQKNLQKVKLKELFKKSSTPISSSSSSTTESARENDTEQISLSDGEIKLPCECSTSIGEIHLCRYANDIRKRVQILKQNPEMMVKQCFKNTGVKVEHQHKYYDNWIAYYVSKAKSFSTTSDDRGTNSYLSSISSNCDTDQT